MENPIKVDDLGYPYFWKHPYHMKFFFLKLDFSRTSSWIEGCVQICGDSGLRFQNILRGAFGKNILLKITILKTKQASPS